MVHIHISIPGGVLRVVDNRVSAGCIRVSLVQDSLSAINPSSRLAVSDVLLNDRLLNVSDSELRGGPLRQVLSLHNLGLSTLDLRGDGRQVTFLRVRVPGDITINFRHVSERGLLVRVTTLETNHVHGSVHAPLLIIGDRHTHSVHVVSLHVLVMLIAVAPQGEQVVCVGHRVIAVGVRHILVDVRDASTSRLITQVPGQACTIMPEPDLTSSHCRRPLLGELGQ